jgi:hypothetical protein
VSIKGNKEREHIHVLIALQRGTREEHDVILEKRTKKQITAALSQALRHDAVLSTDGNGSYRFAAHKLGIESGFFVAREQGHTAGT